MSNYSYVGVNWVDIRVCVCATIMHLSEQAGTYQASVTSAFNATLIGPSDTTIRRSRRHPIASDRQTIRLPPPRRISPSLREHFKNIIKAGLKMFSIS